MGFDLIRYSFYSKFIKYGGIFDKDKNYLGVGEDCNRRIVNRLFNELIDLRLNNKEGYYNHLKVLLIDGYALYENLDPGDDIDEIKEMLGELKEMIDLPVIDDLKEELDQLPDGTLSRLLKNSPNIKALDENLSNKGLMYSLKGFIISEIAVMESHVSGRHVIEEAHFEALKKPANIRILSKYFTQEEFEAIYHRMMKNFVVKNPADQELLFHEMLIYLVDDLNLKPSEAIKDLYALHLYFIKYFNQDLSLLYYYALARYIYITLLHYKNRGKLNDNLTKMLELLSNPNTSIDLLKDKLTPNFENEEEIPEFFRVFECYMADIDNLPDEFIDDERENMVFEFDSRYNHLFDKPESGLGV